MHARREALHGELAQLPEVFLERLIVKKLREQGLEPTTRLAKKLAKHILSAKKGPIQVQVEKALK